MTTTTIPHSSRIRTHSSNDAANEKQRGKRQRRLRQENVVGDFDGVRQYDHESDSMILRAHLLSYPEALSVLSTPIDSDDSDCSSTWSTYSLINETTGVELENDEGHYHDDFPIENGSIRSCPSKSSSVLHLIWFGVGIVFGLLIQVLALSFGLSQRYYHQQQEQPYFQDLNNNEALLDPTTSGWWIVRCLLSQLDLIFDTIIWLTFTVTLVRARMMSSPSSTDIEVDNHVHNRNDVIRRTTTKSNSSIFSLRFQNMSNNSVGCTRAYFVFVTGLIGGSLVAWVCHNHGTIILDTTAEAVIRICWSSILQTILFNGLICFATILSTGTNYEARLHVLSREKTQGGGSFFTGEEKEGRSHHDLQYNNNADSESLTMII